MRGKKNIKLTFYLQLCVFHIKLRLVEFWLEQAVCDSQRSIGHEQHSELELSNKFTCTKIMRLGLWFNSSFSSWKAQIRFSVMLLWQSFVITCKDVLKQTEHHTDLTFDWVQLLNKWTISFWVTLTILLLHDIEWLQQLMFGTLHHTQPGLAFIFKCPEETKNVELSSNHMQTRVVAHMYATKKQKKTKNRQIYQEHRSTIKKKTFCNDA